MEPLVPGIARAEYPDWDALIDRWWSAAPGGAILALDEFPALVANSPELPSLLQKRIDQSKPGRPHLVICGSSQRMMQGLVLDASAPLYGRAKEILKIPPLPAGWIGTAFQDREPESLLNRFATWGGIPRYWELARDTPDHWSALRALVLDPLGVLHEEPQRLLLDDMRDLTQAASLLSLIGQGCHRLSELAGRLGKPATHLSRPMQRLTELGLVRREQPFGAPPRGGKLTKYVIADPFLRFWFRFVEPNRSRLEAGQADLVLESIQKQWPPFLGLVWEELSRTAVSQLEISSDRWEPASRWWGRGINGEPMELDAVANSLDGRRILIGEAKLQLPPAMVDRQFAKLKQKIKNFPPATTREIVPVLFVAKGRKPRQAGAQFVTSREVFSALR